MPAVFTDAPEVRRIAEDLIPLYHDRLVEHRVRMEYLFSDAEIETNGKARWADARRITSLAAFLAGEPDQEQSFEPLTFVCALCNRWRVAGDFAEVTAGDTTYPVCEMCHADAQEWDLFSNKVISKFTKSYETASAKMAAGPPEVAGFFVITVYEIYWRRMSEETKRAVIDHELCHCGAQWDKWGDTKTHLIPHDVEEFGQIIERHGYAWRGDLRNFIAAAQRRDEQMTLELSGKAA